MTTSVKQRGPRVGPTHRVYVTLALPTVEALRAEGEKRGYSLSALAQQMIDRAMAAGLLYAETPSSKVEDLVKMYQSESLVQVHEELRLAMQENIDLLLKKIDIYERRNGQMQQRFKEYAETITKQARDIQCFEQASVADAPDP